jgi:ABC-type lipoprotein release transport system permease subunit
MLFGVGVLDLTAWVSAPALLIAVALLAALSPAVRAARVDPARTLQAD